MAKLKIGIIGCGKIANCDHIPGYKKCPNVEIVALCDIVPEKITATAEKHELAKAKAYSSMEEMMKADNIDAVSICTPNDLHYPMTIAALKRGWHVLCDKPMAFNTDQCTDMIETAKKCGKILHINHSWHYNPYGHKINKMIKEGKIGEFRHATCVSTTMNPPHIAWSPGADWFVQAKHEGSLIQDIAVHLGEMLEWIPDTQIVEAASYTSTRFPGIDVTDNFVAILRYENNATATMELSWTAPSNVFEFVFKGSEGEISIRDWKIYYLKRGAKKAREIKFSPFKFCSQRNFVDAIRGKREQLTPGEVGREAIAICNALTESGQTGKFAKVKKF